MTKPSGRGRHSFIQFYMSDWLAGTARMARPVRSVYFDVCCYNWDKAEPVPKAVLDLMLMDLDGMGDKIVDALVATGQLERRRNGSVFSRRAIAESLRALAAWEGKSQGGKKRSMLKDTSKSVPLEPEPEPEPYSIPVGSAGADDPVDDILKVGLALLTGSGKTEKSAHGLIGKWRKARGDGEVLSAFLDCRNQKISEPVEWLTKRFAGGKRYVSNSGYQYNGTAEQVMREAEKRHDMDIYWEVRRDLDATRKK